MITWNIPKSSLLPLPRLSQPLKGPSLIEIVEKLATLGLGSWTFNRRLSMSAAHRPALEDAESAECSQGEKKIAAYRNHIAVDDRKANIGWKSIRGSKHTCIANSSCSQFCMIKDEASPRRLGTCLRRFKNKYAPWPRHFSELDCYLDVSKNGKNTPYNRNRFFLRSRSIIAPRMVLLRYESNMPSCKYLTINEVLWQTAFLKHFKSCYSAHSSGAAPPKTWEHVVTRCPCVRRKIWCRCPPGPLP